MVNQNARSLDETPGGNAFTVDRSSLQRPSTPSMDRHTYPGKGLLVSQLIFALNEELKRMTYSQSYVADSAHAERPR